MNFFASSTYVVAFAGLLTSLLLAGCVTPNSGVIYTNSQVPSGVIPGRSASGAFNEGYDTPPKLVYGSAPIYPITQRFNRAPGSATVEFIVGTDGKTKDIKIISATYKYFGIHTANAVKDWRFSPALRNGKPVEAKIRQTLKFGVVGWG